MSDISNYLPWIPKELTQALTSEVEAPDMSGGGTDFLGQDLVILSPSLNGAELKVGSFNLIAATSLGDPGDPSFLLPATQDGDIPNFTVIPVSINMGSDLSEVATISTQGDDTFPGGLTTYTVRSDDRLVVFFVIRDLLAPGGLWFPFALTESALQRSTVQDHGLQAGSLALLLKNALQHEVKLSNDLEISFDVAQAVWSPGVRGILRVEQSATGGALLTFDPSVVFDGGVPPVLTAAADAVDVFEFWHDQTSGNVVVRVFAQNVS